MRKESAAASIAMSDVLLSRWATSTARKNTIYSLTKVVCSTRGTTVVLSGGRVGALFDPAKKGAEITHEV